MDLVVPQASAGADLKHRGAGASREVFRFHGTGAEYFRIWIVNLLLTILTLGIYSPWAKVRRNRYIYGSLELSGSYFDYTATPLLILRGRLIAIVLLAAVIIAQSFMPVLYVGSTFLLLLLTPWLIVRSRMFNMRYTSFRNISFAFKPAYGEAYKAIFLYGLLALITLGVMVPAAHFRRNRMIVGNTRFGSLRFGLDELTGKYYFAYGLGVVAGLLLVAPAAGLLARASGSLADQSQDMTGVVAVVSALVGLLLYYVVGKFVVALVLRYTTNGTSLVDAKGARHRLGCDWAIAGMLGIYISNLIAIVLSAGLLTPWAQMRILKYQLDNTWIDLSEPLDGVVATQSERMSSLGEEIGDVFDVDIGF